ncbi:MAG TPA: protein-export chaperone SecB [Gammaproteobacteria bacterium]|nr:protein-export chaperone SecB [Gammaproteobacteria bacterium]
MTEQNNQPATDDAPQFALHRVYLKDVSFETPNSPAIFTEESEPSINVQLNTSVNRLEENVFEVVLNLTVTSKEGERTAFLVEVQQAGIFSLGGFEEEQKGHMLGAYCPNILFPFAREAICDLVVKGGFPQLLLAPINFDALYAQNREQQNSAAAEAQH